MTFDDVDFIAFNSNFCVLECVCESDVLGASFVDLYSRQENYIFFII